MKKLRFSTVIVLLAVLSMGMGFPDIVSETEEGEEIVTTDGARKAKELVKTQAIACSRRIVTKTKQQTAKLENQKQPADDVCVTLYEKATDSLNNIALKLFDNKGNILLIENVKIAEFFSTDYPANKLPEGSRFVMFYGNTAYYFLDKQEVLCLNETKI